MPTKTKDAVAEIEEGLAGLERKRQRAAAAIAEAEGEASEIRARQDEIAVAVIGEDEAAVAEMAGLEESLLVATRRAAVARTAVEQLEAQSRAAREDLAEEHRRIHQERFEELGRQRRELEESLEEQMVGLLDKLAELRGLDQAQRQAAYLAGRGDTYATHVLAHVISNWIAARLGGADGYVPLSLIEHYKEHTLAELDPLAIKPPLAPLSRD